MFTSSSVRCGHLLVGGGLFHGPDEEANAGAKLGRGALERGQRSLVASRSACRIGDAPMDELGCARKFRTDLAHAIAEADHMVEALPSELAQVLRATAGDVDPALTHHPHRVGVQRLGVATRAGCPYRAAGQL